MSGEAGGTSLHFVRGSSLVPFYRRCYRVDVSLGATSSVQVSLGYRDGSRRFPIAVFTLASERGPASSPLLAGEAELGASGRVDVSAPPPIDRETDARYVSDRLRHWFGEDVAVTLRRCEPHELGLDEALSPLLP